MTLWWLFAFCFGAYIIGCVSFSTILSKHVLKNDVTKLGSGNPGATNMLRNFGFKWGLGIFFLDMLKGAIPTLIAVLCFGGFNSDNGQIAMYACGLSAVVGHCFPLQTGFRGGKGVSTTIGVFLIINPWIALLGFAIGLLITIATDYVSIGSITFLTLCVLWEAFMNTPTVAVSSMLIAFYVLVMFMHRKNIKNLLSGTEKKVHLFKKKKKT